MNQQKHIQREGEGTAKLFDDRSLEADYATLLPLLQQGWRVLDVGCGTGAISAGIAERVGAAGHVTGIDNTAYFIDSGKQTYADVSNLELHHADLFAFDPSEKFDLIVTARVLQWLNDPLAAIIKLRSMLKPGGILSVLDYNHELLEWQPEPPASMRQFYATFLRWRAEAGMDNLMADDLPGLFADAGLSSIEILEANEAYKKGEANFSKKVGIWSSVAQSIQMVEEGYISDADRLLAIDEYNKWIETDAQLMVMKLKEVRGTNN
ncbi:methyltransferase domain-containing protein [Mucilaginibacter pallidiroseus]|uniref:Methyltransferase domain-containing protein n=1 Tax=Mucilaginibacter pallidiroseus TaxID=2599295 RepID=A0A563UD35_9SPHI|nr:methyltransferase domain-containing protein [Mucilaginibacter pallidiroseus]TWR29277.1 methyltransferase domain-containing protein [Mucilaginibacter pallidiroseus]